MRGAVRDGGRASRSLRSSSDGRKAHRLYRSRISFVDFLLKVKSGRLIKTEMLDQTWGAIEIRQFGKIGDGKVLFSS